MYTGARTFRMLLPLSLTLSLFSGLAVPSPVEGRHIWPPAGQPQALWSPELQSSSAAALEWSIGGVRMESPARLPKGNGKTVVWTDTLRIEPREEQVLELSLNISHLSLGPKDVLILRSQRGTEAGTELLYTAGDIQSIVDADGAFWTPALSGNTVTLELITSPSRTKVHVRIPAYRTLSRADALGEPSAGVIPASDDNARTDDIYGRDNMVWIAKAPVAIYDERGPVARLDTGNGLCTAFLIGPDLMMTNQHCIASQSTCSNSKAQFNYELDDSGRPLPSDDFACAELLQSDEDLDYAVFRVRGTPGDQYGWYSLDPRVPTGEQGTLIQHPGGKRKKVAFDPNCSLLKIDDGNAPNSDFNHQCDTESGSSGSPVLDANFNVVGLHHFGGATRAGGISANQAVRIDLIVEDCTVCGN